MNAVVQYDSSVPAFLRQANFLALNTKAAAGLSSGAPPRLSFRGSRFRLISADGTEAPLPAEGQPGNNSITVDVIVVDASDGVAKAYYDKAYDPNADDLSPACFSDNNIGPSSRAAHPQALLCQGCPKNAWGSKVTPTGSQVKACGDAKKLAIVPVSNIDGPAYVLAIPGASLKTWTAAVNAVTQRGIPIPALVFRLGFDQDPAYPKLTFAPVRYISEQEAGSIQDLFGSDECAELVGRKDTPILALPAGAGGSVAAPSAPVGNSHTAPAQPIYAPQPVQQQAPMFAPPPAQATPPFLQQPAAQPAPTEAAPRRRGRPARAAEPGPVQHAAPAPGPQPAPNGASLDAMLDAVMSGN